MDKNKNEGIINISLHLPFYFNSITLYSTHDDFNYILSVCDVLKKCKVRVLMVFFNTGLVVNFFKENNKNQ